MPGSTGVGWKRSDLATVTGVAQPTGKPAEDRPQALPSGTATAPALDPTNLRPRGTESRSFIPEGAGPCQRVVWRVFGRVVGVRNWPLLFPAADMSVADGPGGSRTGLSPGRVAAP